MKSARLIPVALLAAVIALPFTAFAAKADRKKADDSHPAFAAVDKDNNGSVSQAEFVAALKEKLGEDGAKAKFTELDKDKDGKLSAEEYAAAAPEKKKKRKKDAN
jgi:Ca2+-binding EF-hand superfamily protein